LVEFDYFDDLLSLIYSNIFNISNISNIFNISNISNIFNVSNISNIFDFNLNIILDLFCFIIFILSILFSLLSSLLSNLLIDLYVYIKEVDILSFINISNFINTILGYTTMKLLIKIRIVVKSLIKFIIYRIILFSISLVQYIVDYLFKTQTILNI
jgi:hypothetical protein